MNKFSLLLTAALFALVGILSFTLTASADTTNLAPEIVGGTVADVGEYPYMVAIGNKSGLDMTQWCGGSLIHEEWVLTAAHCVEDEIADDLRVGIGVHRISTARDDGTLHDISQIVIHPQYNNGASLNNDIALLKLSTPSDAPIIVPVFDADTALSAAGVDSTVTGWGLTTEGGNGSDVLREVQVPLVSNATCADSYGSSSITTKMICAGLANGGKDACQNDSGGPLVVRDTSNNWRQVGVVSWGSGCARPDAYGVYARVSEFTEWIEGFTGELGSTPTAVSVTQSNTLQNTSLLPIYLVQLLVVLTALTGAYINAKD